jgi:hypothetical protein
MYIHTVRQLQCSAAFSLMNHVFVSVTEVNYILSQCVTWLCWRFLLAASAAHADSSSTAIGGSTSFNTAVR